MTLRSDKVEAEEAGREYLALEHIEPSTGRRLDDDSVTSEGIATLFEAGDVLFSKLRPYLAKVYAADKRGMATTELLVMVAEPVVLPSFLKFLLLSGKFIDAVAGATYGAKMPRANWDMIGGVPVALPSLAEQAHIAEFLGWKTRQIDALGAKKQTLIESLGEERLAVITATVTRGLDPNTSMRQSAVPWLGDLPAHWSVKRIKFVAHIGNGSTPARDDSAYWADGSFPWLNSSVVNQRVVTEAEQFVTPLALAECHLPKIVPPAVLIGITGQGKTRGLATTLAFEATINQHIAFVKPDETQVHVGYLRRVFDAAYSYLRSESDGGGSTKGAITCEQIAEMAVPVPPLVEQRAIASHIDERLARIDAMSASAKDAIDKLTEYRSALITAAVTGQIDVRNIAVPDAA